MTTLSTQPDKDSSHSRYNAYMPATIKDVARIAGVSIKTVSRVINDEPHVTEDTRMRVQAAVRATGYAPNISARRLVQNKSFMICILMYPGFYQTASALLNITMDISYEENYDILIQPYFPTHARSRQKLVSLIYEHRIDGFVTTPPCDSEDFVADLLNTYKVPLVQINPFHHSDTIPYVSGEDLQGAYDMTSHLIQLGHRRISFLMGPRNMRASFDRLAGYKECLAANGIEVRDDLIQDSEFTFDGGYTAARLLLDGKAQPPTAIFAGNDEAAYGAIFAAMELGFNIPGQLSICGFDDLSMSKNIWPGLTTVHQPSEEIVEIATRMLIRRLKNQSQAPERILVPSRLEIRKSTAPPPTSI
jgi:LacI family transcriptional regulator